MLECPQQGMDIVIRQQMGLIIVIEDPKISIKMKEAIMSRNKVGYLKGRAHHLKIKLPHLLLIQLKLRVRKVRVKKMFKSNLETVYLKTYLF